MSEITEIKTLNGYPLADTKARADIATLTEEIEALKKGDESPSVTYKPDIAGAYSTQHGITDTVVNTFRTDYISLDGYVRIVAKTYLVSSYYALAFFDASKTLLRDISIPGTGVNTPNEIDMPVPAGAAYCMLSDYGVNDASLTLYTEITSEGLYGKKIAILGDSISSVDYALPNYWQIIAEKTGINPLNYGVSASRIATVDGDRKESFVTRAAAMDTSADAVLVMGGTNDVGLETTLGEWASTDESTFYGALNTLIALLRTNYPGKPIIFCTPIKRQYDTDDGFPATMADLKTASATEKITMQHCALAIKAKCARHGIPVIDLAEHSGIGAECAEYYMDNLHPSALGHVRIANMVQAELEKQFLQTAD
jgi:lysophospholipase L1-like esterase